MAKWYKDANRSALADFNKSVTASGIDRAQAAKLQNDIDFWASTISSQNYKLIDSPSGHGYFEVHAENREVLQVKYCPV